MVWRGEENTVEMPTMGWGLFGDEWNCEFYRFLFFIFCSSFYIVLVLYCSCFMLFFFYIVLFFSIFQILLYKFNKIRFSWP
jgi:hypothetical protein